MVSRCSSRGEHTSASDEIIDSGILQFFKFNRRTTHSGCSKKLRRATPTCGSTKLEYANLVKNFMHTLEAVVSKVDGVDAWRVVNKESNEVRHSSGIHKRVPHFDDGG